LGDRSNILNNKPIIGAYGVNNSGSSDMYSKGAAIMFMIRNLTNNDDLFRKMLRGLGHDFYHRIVNTQQIEQYIADKTNLDLKAFFNHYLRNEALPQLEYYIKDKKTDKPFDLEAIAELTQGFSGAQLKNLINEAAIKSTLCLTPKFTISSISFSVKVGKFTLHPGRFTFFFSPRK
jgi:predicted metalloprotease with PDZ domain